MCGRDRRASTQTGDGAERRVHRRLVEYCGEESVAGWVGTAVRRARVGGHGVQNQQIALIPVNLVVVERIEYGT
eukprot:SAG11_NODE_2989_length_2787_cov_1.598586_2_plen_74_part_00